MKKFLLLSMLLLTMVGCGKTESVFTPDYKGQIDDNTNRITQLEDRVDLLEDSVLKLNDDLSSLSDDVDVLEADLEGLGDELDDEIDARKTSDRRLSRKIQRANRARRQLEARFARFARYQSHVNSEQGRVNKTLFKKILLLDRRFSRGFRALNARIDDLEIEDIAGLELALKKINISLGRLGHSVGSLGQDLSGLRSELVALAAKLSALTADVSDIEDAIDAIDAAILQLQQPVPHPPALPCFLPPFFVCGGVA